MEIVNLPGDTVGNLSPELANHNHVAIPGQVFLYPSPIRANRERGKNFP
jgi:hypothetical protein